MALANSQTIYEATGFDVAICEKIERFASRAALEAKRLLSSTRSEDEATGTETEGSATYTTRLDRIGVRYAEIEALGADNTLYQYLELAESLLAVYYALPALNLRITKEGGLATAIGLVEGQRDLMTQREMQAYRREFYRQARELLDDLRRDEDYEPIYAI